jgi:hypothetical protein
MPRKSDNSQHADYNKNYEQFSENDKYAPKNNLQHCHSPAFSAHGLHSVKPSGIEITAMPHFRQGDMSMPDLSSSSESRQSRDLASAIT